MDSGMTARGPEDESLPPPQSSEEYRLLAGLVSSIKDFSRMNAQEQNFLICELEAYECYRQADLLLRWRLGRPESTHQQLMQDYLWLMEVQYLGFDSFEAFVEVARLYVRKMQVPFASIRLHVLEQILGPENFKEHALLLQAIAADVYDVAQRVLLLERLALIYEKKLFLENEHEEIYRQILQLDQTNQKALKFFKLSCIHNMEWAKATEYLKVLAQHSQNPQERVRHSHELAQLYLYNLNQPGAALELLKPLAMDYPETRHSLIEAFERLDLHEELLSTLLGFERSSRDVEDISQFKFRRGHVLMKLGRAKEAVSVFKEALKFRPDFLLGHESLISALVEIGSLADLSNELQRLVEVVKLDGSRLTINELIERSRSLSQLPTSLAP
jgi:tetratricopeptide (TPR) repeat protein